MIDILLTDTRPNGIQYYEGDNSVVEFYGRGGKVQIVLDKIDLYQLYSTIDLRLKQLGMIKDGKK